MEHIYKKEKFISKLIQAKVIFPNTSRHKNPNGYHRPFCWKTRLISSNLTEDWDDYFSYYRSDDEAWYCLLNNCEVPLCPICGKQVKFYTDKGFGFKTTCGICSANAVPSKKEKCKNALLNKSLEQKHETVLKRKKTNLERYGEENYQSYGSESFKNKMLVKHGDIHYHNINKTRQTCLKKYGVSTNLLLNSEGRSKRVWEEQYSSIILKRQQTCLERFGAVSPNSVPEVISKMQATKRCKISKIEQDNNCTLVTTLLKEYGPGWLRLDLPRITLNSHSYVSNTYIEKIRQYKEEGTHTNSYTSKPEKEVVEFIRELGIEVQENVTNIVPNNNHRYYELDIYLPKYKVAFEFNGVYWHSRIFKDKNYHIRKTKACEKVGVRLIHIFEDLWNTKKDIYKSIIRSVVNKYDSKIYARECTVRELGSDEYNEFLDNNHLQGHLNSSKRFGLIYNGRIVQVIGFGKSRFKENEFELYRMCTEKYTQVLGGFSKLIKHCNILKFVSYVDRSIYTGEGYKAIGFNFIGETPPSYYYVKNNMRLNRMQCQKHKLKDLLKNFDENLTEQENMLNNNYLQIYDCGNIKVEYVKEI